MITVGLKGNVTPNACLTYSSDPRAVFNMVVLEFFEKTNFCPFWVLGFVGIHWFKVIRVGPMQWDVSSVISTVQKSHFLPHITDW